MSKENEFAAELHCLMVESDQNPGMSFSEYYQKVMTLIDTHYGSKIRALEGELETTNYLLKQRERLLEAIPECPSHGPCIPHALDWIKNMKEKYENNEH